jgi:hypothetical protein
LVAGRSALGDDLFRNGRLGLPGHLRGWFRPVFPAASPTGMNPRGQRPRSWRLLAVALVASLALWAGAIAAALRPGGISSLFGEHDQVVPVTAGARPDRNAHPAKHLSGSAPQHSTASGRATPPLIAERRVHRPFREKPLVARPLVAEIESSRALLEIPAIGVRAPLVPTGAKGAPGTASLTIPDNIHTVSWWDGTVLDGDRVVHENAPSPGQPGVAVIAGHIDSAQDGAGALYDLKDLDKGDTIKIVDSLGRISTWTVSAAPETALKTNLPPALWVSTGPPKLAIVTCGGPFDAATGHYLDNVIVWATPSSLSRGRRTPRH